MTKPRLSWSKSIWRRINTLSGPQAHNIHARFQRRFAHETRDASCHLFSTVWKGNRLRLNVFIGHKRKRVLTELMSHTGKLIKWHAIIDQHDSSLIQNDIRFPCTEWSGDRRLSEARRIIIYVFLNLGSALLSLNNHEVFCFVCWRPLPLRKILTTNYIFTWESVDN